MRKENKKLLAIGATLCVAAAAVVLPQATTSAQAADLPQSNGSFSGTARNYGVFAGLGLLNNTVNARANIAESVVAVNSRGLSDYAGTGVGQLAVPGDIANDPTARAYSRAAPIGAGFTGLNLNPVRSQSTATTIQGTASDDQDFGSLDLRPLGTIGALTGQTSTTWTDSVLKNGGTVASSSSNTGEVQLVPEINVGGVSVPGVSDVLPLGRADLGQNTNAVNLVPLSNTSCPAGLAVETTSTWKFADVQLFGGNVGVSWGGESGADDTGTITARATGLPGGASLTVSQLPTMTVQIGGPNGRALTIEPGAAIELSDLFAGSTLGSTLARIVDGQLTYGGTTNRVETADGTRAAGSMNGLNADLTLLPVPIIAPAGLGSAELGFERVDVEATASEGGINCSTDGSTNGSTTGSTTGTTTGSTDGSTTGSTDGSTTGTTNGSTTGSTDGSTTGTATGSTTGTTNGSTNGSTTGTTNGSTTGSTDGSTTGTATGSTTGSTTGTTNGSINGSTTGTTNGSTTGSTDGSTTGTTNGSTTGSTDGSTTGTANGSTTGTTNGSTNGSTTGTTNGTTTGATNGSTTGSTNGSATGTANGSTTGTANGSTTGAINGSTTGTANGSTAGTSNGSTAGAASGSTSGAVTGAANGASAGSANGSGAGGSSVAQPGGRSSLAVTGLDSQLMTGAAVGGALLAAAGVLMVVLRSRGQMKRRS